VKRNFRLTRSIDFKRVRNEGKSYAHPLVVLVASPTADEAIREMHSRVGVTAGRAVGGAVERNRAKRLLREAMRFLLPGVRPGWDLVLIARQPLSTASYEQVQSTLLQLLQRAKLLKPPQP
jgi:ribonuclease P protein component